MNSTIFFGKHFHNLSATVGNRKQPKICYRTEDLTNASKRCRFFGENQSDIAALLLQEKPLDVQQTSIYILTEKLGCEHPVNVSVSDRGEVDRHSARHQVAQCVAHVDSCRGCV